MTSTLCHDYRSWFRNPDQDSAGPQAANLDPEQAEAHARSCASCGSLSAAYSSSVEAVKESYSAPLSRDAEDAFMAEALRRFQPTRSKRISKLTELLRIPGSWRIPAPVQLARPLAFAFGAAMMLVLLVQAPSWFAPSTSPADLRGTLHALRAGESARPEAVAVGARVEASQLPVTLGDGVVGSILLAPQSALQVADWSADRVRVHLLSGAVIAKVNKRAPGQSFEVRTPAAIVRVVGTEFVVRREADGTTTVVGREGVVAVLDDEERMLGEVRAGETMVVPAAEGEESGDEALPVIALDDEEGAPRGTAERPTPPAPDDERERPVRAEAADKEVPLINLEDHADEAAEAPAERGEKERPRRAKVAPRRSAKAPARHATKPTPSRADTKRAARRSPAPRPAPPADTMAFVEEPDLEEPAPLVAEPLPDPSTLSAEGLSRLARKRLARGEDSAAIELLEDAIRGRHARSIPVLRLLADALRISGRHDYARRTYEQAIAVAAATDRPTLLVDLANLLERDLRRPGEAARLWKRYLDEKPRGRFAATALLRIAHERHRTDDHAAEEALLRRILDEHPRRAEAYRALTKLGRELLDADRFDDAARLFAKHRRARSAEMAETAWVGLMHARLGQRRLSEVRRLLEAYAAEFPLPRRGAEVERIRKAVSGE